MLVVVGMFVCDSGFYCVLLLLVMIFMVIGIVLLVGMCEVVWYF